MLLSIQGPEYSNHEYYFHYFSKYYALIFIFIPGVVRTVSMRPATLLDADRLPAVRIHRAKRAPGPVRSIR